MSITRGKRANWSKRFRCADWCNISFRFHTKTSTQVTSVRYVHVTFGLQFVPRYHKLNPITQSATTFWNSIQNKLVLFVRACENTGKKMVELTLQIRTTNYGDDWTEAFVGTCEHFSHPVNNNNHNNNNNNSAFSVFNHYVTMHSGLSRLRIKPSGTCSRTVYITAGAWGAYAPKNNNRHTSKHCAKHPAKSVITSLQRIKWAYRR